MNKKTNRSKISMDTDAYTYSLLKERSEATGQTIGSIINKALKLTVDIPEDIQEDVFFTLSNRVNMLALNEEKTGLFFAELNKRLGDFYKDFAEFITCGKQIQLKENDSEKYKKITLKDGILRIPNKEDWYVLPDAVLSPEESTRAYVIEVMNSDIDGIPHFVFFANSKNDYNEEQVYDKCEEAWNGFEEKVVEKQGHRPDPKSPDDFLNSDSTDSIRQYHSTPPVIGIFPVTATDDWHYDTDKGTPFNCLIVRGER